PRLPDDVRGGIEAPVTLEEKLRQPLRGKVWVMPGNVGAVIAIEVALGEQPLSPEFLVLLRSRNVSEKVKRRHIGRELLQHLEMLQDRVLRVRGEAQYVGEVARDPVLGAEADDLGVLARGVVKLVRHAEGSRVERLGTDENLEATRARQQAHELRLP